MLRALANGLRCFFDPAIYGHHEELDVVKPDDAMISKGRGYARGFGHVLRRHSYGKLTAALWISRPIIRLLLSLFRGNLKQCTYLLNVSLGRAEGYIGRTW